MLDGDEGVKTGAVLDDGGSDEDEDHGEGTMEWVEGCCSTFRGGGMFGWLVKIDVSSPLDDTSVRRDFLQESPTQCSKMFQDQIECSERKDQSTK